MPGTSPGMTASNGAPVAQFTSAGLRPRRARSASRGSGCRAGACGRRRAAGAGAFHVEIDDAILEAAEGDVAAVIGDRRPHAGLDQILDHVDGLGIGLVEELILVVEIDI